MPRFAVGAQPRCGSSRKRHRASKRSIAFGLALVVTTTRPATSGSPRSSLSVRCSSHSGRGRQSASVKARRRASVAATPRLRARARPGRGSVTTVAPRARATSAVRSREALSMTTHSKSRRVCASSASARPPSARSPSRTVVMTAITGPVCGSARLRGSPSPVRSGSPRGSTGPAAGRRPCRRRASARGATAAARSGTRSTRR